MLTTSHAARGQSSSVIGCEPRPGASLPRMKHLTATWPLLVNLAALPMRLRSMSTSQSGSATT